MSSNLTGLLRHRVVTTGMLKKKTYLVLQCEVEGQSAENNGGRVDTHINKWWVDAKPEWFLTYNLQDKTK